MNLNESHSNENINGDKGTNTYPTARSCLNRFDIYALNTGTEYENFSKHSDKFHKLEESSIGDEKDNVNLEDQLKEYIEVQALNSASVSDSDTELEDNVDTFLEVDGDAICNAESACEIISREHSDKEINVDKENYLLNEDTHLQEEFLNGECLEDHLEVQVREYSSDSPNDDGNYSCNVNDVQSSEISDFDKNPHDFPIDLTVAQNIFAEVVRYTELQKTQNTDQFFPCPKCGRKFKDKAKLQRHLITHTDERPYDCHFCGKGLKDKQSLQNHIRRHAGERPHCCDVCGKGFIEKKSLRTHIRIHSDERPFQCPICRKSFTQSSHLQEHQRLHTGEKPFNCPECGKMFKWRNSLRRHVAIHKGNYAHCCATCGKKFLQKCHLESHLYTHSDVLSFFCKDCGKGFKQKSALQSHAKIHTGIYPHVCTLCGKGFPKRNKLVVHIRTHTGECPFECQECGKKFKQKAKLHHHFQKSHVITSFSCPLCDKKFDSQSTFEQHISIHSEPKKYDCSYCEMTFAVPNELDAHIQIHSDIYSRSERQYNENYCEKPLMNGTSDMFSIISNTAMSEPISLVNQGTT